MTKIRSLHPACAQGFHPPSSSVPHSTTLLPSPGLQSFLTSPSPATAATPTLDGRSRRVPCRQDAGSRMFGQNFGGDGLWVLLFKPTWHDWTDIVHPCVAGDLWSRGRPHRGPGAGLHAHFPHQALPIGRHLQRRYGGGGLPILYQARCHMHATLAPQARASHFLHPLLQPCCSCSSWSTMGCFLAVPWEP